MKKYSNLFEFMCQQCNVTKYSFAALYINMSCSFKVELHDILDVNIIVLLQRFKHWKNVLIILIFRKTLNINLIIGQDDDATHNIQYCTRTHTQIQHI